MLYSTVVTIEVHAATGAVCFVSRWPASFGFLSQEFEVATAKVLEQQDAKVAARTQRKLVAEAVKADREVGCCCVTSFFVLTACLTG